MNEQKVRYIIGVIFCLLLAGCTSTPATGAPTLTSTSPLPTDDRATARAVPSVTLQSTSTAVAQTPTPKPSPHPTATLPDVPLSQDGPWMVFLSAFGHEQDGLQYLWAINDDGTGLTKLVDEPVLAFNVRPDASARLGATIAYVAYSQVEEPDYTLKLLSLPDGKVTPVTPLFKDTTDKYTYDLLTALMDDGLTWSPLGNLLAFVGMMDGSSIDVYVYDFAAGAITRLSVQPSQAYRLSWSPDGRYLVYQGFDFFGMQGAESVGVWSVKADGTATLPLLERTGVRGDVYYEAWSSATEIALVNQSWDPSATSSIHMLDVEQGTADVVIEAVFAEAAFAPGHDTWLLMKWYNPTADTPLILYRRGQQQEIPSKGIMNIEWLSGYDVFLGQTAEGIRYAITPDGQITEIPIGPDWGSVDMRYRILSVSPDEQLWAWYLPELWIGAPMSQPVQVLPENPDQSRPLMVNMVTWSPDGKRLMVCTDQGLYNVELPGFEVRLVTRSITQIWYGHEWQIAWLP